MIRRLWITPSLVALASILGAGAAMAAPPDGGTISIEPKTGNGDYDSSMTVFVNAATEALSGKGFTILEDSGHAQYVAELVLDRADVGTGTAKVLPGKSSVSPGNAPGVGAGVTIPLPSGNSRLVPIQRIQLTIHIHKRGDSSPVWNGAAVTVREIGTRRGANDVVATALSQAVLSAYPIEAEQVVGVP